MAACGACERPEPFFVLEVDLEVVEPVVAFAFVVPHGECSGDVADDGVDLALKTGIGQAGLRVGDEVAEGLVGPEQLADEELEALRSGSRSQVSRAAREARPQPSALVPW